MIDIIVKITLCLNKRKTDALENNEKLEVWLGNKSSEKNLTQN